MKQIFFVVFITIIAYHNSVATGKVVRRGGYVKSTETSYIYRDVSVLDPRFKK